MNMKRADEWISKGLDHFREGNYGEALKCYDKALTIDPQYSKIWLRSNKVL